MSRTTCTDLSRTQIEVPDSEEGALLVAIANLQRAGKNKDNLKIRTNVEVSCFTLATLRF
jgi:hypothetical protein